jgi:hypothetical protein
LFVAWPNANIQTISLATTTYAFYWLVRWYMIPDFKSDIIFSCAFIHCKLVRKSRSMFCINGRIRNLNDNLFDIEFQLFYLIKRKHGYFPKHLWNDFLHMVFVNVQRF